MFRYGASVGRQSLQSNAEYMLCCCFHTKVKEISLVSATFGVPLLIAMIVIVTAHFESAAALYIMLAVIILAAITDLVLCFICTVVLSVWFCTLRKHTILKGKAKLMCKQTVLIIGLLAVYFLPWMLLPVAFFFALQLPYLLTAWAVFIYSIQVIIPLLFFVYICVSVCKIKQSKEHVQENIPTNTMNSTAPPSTRVSLPSDTAAHAPNFLSPSTAEPIEVTVLLGN